VPVSGLVITRATNVEDAELRARLSCVPGLELGPSSGPRHAATLDAEDVDGHDAALARISTIDGVLFVDLAFHDHSDVERIAYRPRHTRHRGSSHGTT
jgi:nitrate reductase NapAB chaperone NapD